MEKKLSKKDQKENILTQIKAITKKKVKVKLCDVKIDMSIYPREKPDEATIDKYVENIDEILKNSEMHISQNMYGIDGTHRKLAAEKAGNDKEEVTCTMWMTKDKHLIQAISIMLNARHGKGFSSKETRINVERLYQEGLQKNEICGLLFISERLYDVYTKTFRDAEKKDLESKIMAMTENGKSQAEIAKELKVSQATVSRVIKDYSKKKTAEMNKEDVKEAKAQDKKTEAILEVNKKPEDGAQSQSPEDIQNEKKDMISDPSRDNDEKSNSDPKTVNNIESKESFQSRLELVIKNAIKELNEDELIFTNNLFKKLYRLLSLYLNTEHVAAIDTLNRAIMQLLMAKEKVNVLQELYDMANTWCSANNVGNTEMLNAEVSRSQSNNEGSDKAESDKDFNTVCLEHFQEIKKKNNVVQFMAGKGCPKNEYTEGFVEKVGVDYVLVDDGEKRVITPFQHVSVIASIAK